MKKVISAILVLLFVFSLCPVGYAASFPYSMSDMGSGTNDALEVEAVKFESRGSFSVKIKNNYFNDSGLQPNRIMLSCQLLDNQGSILESTYFIYEGLAYGQSGWTSMSTSKKYPDVAAVTFTGYNFQFDTHDVNAPGTVYGIGMFGGGVFTDPPVFYAAPVGQMWGRSDLKEPDSTVVLLALGDSIKTTDLEITVTDCVFQGSVDIGSGVSLAASGDDMILACMTFDIRNLSKELLKVKDILDVKVDYNDGFIYSTQDKFCYLLEAEDNDPSLLTFKYNGSASGTSFELSPLASDKFILAIPCIDLIGEDDGLPLKIVFTLPNDGQLQTYEYIIR